MAKVWGGGGGGGGFGKKYKEIDGRICGFKPSTHYELRNICIFVLNASFGK